MAQRQSIRHKCPVDLTVAWVTFSSTHLDCDLPLVEWMLEEGAMAWIQTRQTHHHIAGVTAPGGSLSSSLTHFLQHCWRRAAAPLGTDRALPIQRRSPLDHWCRPAARCRSDDNGCLATALVRTPGVGQTTKPYLVPFRDDKGSVANARGGDHT